MEKMLAALASNLLGGPGPALCRRARAGVGLQNLDGGRIEIRLQTGTRGWSSEVPVNTKCDGLIQRGAPGWNTTPLVALNTQAWFPWLPWQRSR
jgi:hypothetical protein